MNRFNLLIILQFCDALNVRNKSEGDRKHKNFLKPYRNIDDPGFDWLQNGFKIYQTGKKALKNDWAN